ncbi:MAG: TldD/PmbA family protein [Nitrospinaceae bacterium]|jgi:predicted Zn-dependent protease|nr:TldD/PmbA family protein [Nitrospinaceae bacterium]MBT3435498.1 TldD/PmbA family protein [Nitrospinaceae bacterium]MBT3822868.1 TldD/PmbA family protein [Nitrospinaceae bacterium]MBT4094598.1 TldD/PmbA family protein [Nitrospinaceae bacterium]MBT4432342.1 TldD/PmbA family protein [Nitrospinaceae bacterium]
MHESVAERFKEIVPDVDSWSIRILQEKEEQISVRKNIPQPFVKTHESGAMITIWDQGGVGYAAASDFSKKGLKKSAENALAWARRSASHMVPGLFESEPSCHEGDYSSPVGTPWEQISLAEKLDFLKEVNNKLNTGGRIIEWFAFLNYLEEKSLLVTSAGGSVHQMICALIPNMGAVANAGSESQRRTYGGRGHARQGGWESVRQGEMLGAAPEVTREAEELLFVPNCPEGDMDLLLSPDQMILQIHESIGHPLELDRILGDERNYAGTSFITLDKFGDFRYGSNLLNVVFDPGELGELASYAFDDEGSPASREYLIRNGILVRGIGGELSQARSGVPGVSCSRAVGWNRPPIDRMANINIEPGDSSLEEMIASVERGVYMKTNCSWSIDDSRRKFQFGCEWARLIENGELMSVVKNPNYRGVTDQFWQNLTMLGNRDTFEVLGTPNCGKGEPNQMVRVGHATPACLFNNIEVFGGE